MLGCLVSDGTGEPPQSNLKYEVKLYSKESAGSWSFFLWRKGEKRRAARTVGLKEMAEADYVAVVRT